MVMTTAGANAARPGRLMPVLFTATIFTSALLLFFVQPLFTRIVLPQIGGAAAVWTTAMLFFQTVLIGGYLYAHLMSRHVPTLLQIVIHVGLLLIALLFLPLAIPEGWKYDPSRPVVTQTLMLYALGVGLPFAVLSANAPLIQSWYRKSGGPSADDPYFLYAASNLGSLVALLAFPLVAEPLFGVRSISLGWMVGFIALVPLLLLCGLAARRDTEPASTHQDVGAGRAAPGARTLAWWAFLAFLPSSLMLCVTTKISTDLGSFPLVWVIPLALYLLTFVLVFSTRSPLTGDRLRKLLPAVLAVLVLFSLQPLQTLGWIAILLLAFFVVGLLAHRLLFEARPDARSLTVFYLTMSVGGALGGLFNSIVAPILFDRLLEFPVTIALIAVLLLRWPTQVLPRDIALGVGLGAVVLTVLMLDIPVLHLHGHAGNTFLVLVLLMAIYAVFARRPTVSAATTVAILWLWGMVSTAGALLVERSFFGVHLVRVHGPLLEYSNGTTVHGAQLIAETTGKPTPMTYFHPRGVIAQIMTDRRKMPVRSVGIVGLGTGALACYRQPGQDWHFYEIDPMVVEIAKQSGYFRFMSECGPDVPVHIGDARIVLQEQTDLKFDILVIDAYSSDAIPLHLATVEAIQLYLDRLNPGGILVFHVSNRFYDLAQALSVAAQDLGLVGRYRAQPLAELEGATGAYPSQVVTLARKTDDLGIAATDPAWQPLPEPRIQLWTDDYANLLSVLN